MRAEANASGRDGMTGPIDAGAADAAPIRPSVGLSLLGEYQGSGFTEPRFLVRRGDGQVIQLSRLLYLVTTAIAQGGPDGGWDTARVAEHAGAAFGRKLTLGNIRYLVDGKLAPLGITAADHTEPLPDARGARLLPRNRTWRRAIAIGGAGILATAAALVVTGTGTGTRESADTASAAAASSAQAAAWVAQQVSPDAIVSSDPRTCREIQQDGFPAGRLQPLTSTARNPLGSAIVVATPAVRAQFGAGLAADYAPQVIASFGSGAARVDVRTVAPDGAAAFRTQLAAEHAALVAAGRQLLENTNIRPSPSARTALRAGLVDVRLLAILAALSQQMPVKLVAFTAAAVTSADVPLRGAEISTAATAGRSAILAFLRAQQTPYQPATVTVSNSNAGDAPLVALRFDAPSFPDAAQP